MLALNTGDMKSLQNKYIVKIRNKDIKQGLPAYMPEPIYLHAYTADKRLYL